MKPDKVKSVLLISCAVAVVFIIVFLLVPEAVRKTGSIFNPYPGLDVAAKSTTTTSSSTSSPSTTTPTCLIKSCANDGDCNGDDKCVDGCCIVQSGTTTSTSTGSSTTDTDTGGTTTTTTSGGGGGDEIVLYSGGVVLGDNGISIGANAALSRGAAGFNVSTDLNINACNVPDSNAALVIYDLHVQLDRVDGDYSNARLIWSTNKQASSQAAYARGVKIKKYDNKSDLNSNLETFHIVILDNLPNDSTYHFSVFSVAGDEKAMSEDFIFQTLRQYDSLWQMIANAVKSPWIRK